MSIDEQIAAAKRELAMRKRCYPGWVNQNRITKEEAAKETEAMAYIVSSLTELRDLRNGQQTMFP